MNIERLKEAARQVVMAALDGEEWDDLAREVFVRLARRAAAATTTTFDDKAVEYLIRKLDLDEPAPDD